MLRVSEVLEEGKQAYRDGKALDACPYDPPEGPCVIDGWHGAKLIGKVRTDIDFEQIWQTGWDIAKRYEPQHAAKHSA